MILSMHLAVALTAKNNEMAEQEEIVNLKVNQRQHLMGGMKGRRDIPTPCGTNVSNATPGATTWEKSFKAGSIQRMRNKYMKCCQSKF